MRTYQLDHDGHPVSVHEEAYERHYDGRGVKKRGVHDEVKDGKNGASELLWEAVRVKLPKSIND